MPNFKDLGLEAPLKGQDPDDMDSEAVNSKTTNHQQYGNKSDGRKEDKQGPAKKHPGEMMRSDKPNYGQPENSRKNKVSRDYICTRASGPSAGFQNQPLMKPDGIAKTETCCVCTEVCSREDQMVFTKCCGIAIGAQCRAEHIAYLGECWNCGEEAVQSEAASEAETWISWDPKDFPTQAPHLPQYPKYANLDPAKDPGRQQPTAMLKAGSTLPSGSTTGGSNTPGTSNPRDSKPPEAIQPHLLGLTENQNGREAAMHQSKDAKQESKTMRTAPESSSNLVNGLMKNNGVVSGGFDKASATPPMQQEDFLYAGSVSTDSSDLCEDDQQQVRGLSEEEHKRQDAKQHVIEATKHLVEMCNTYGDEINEADTDEVMNAILEAVGGCKTFKAAIARRISEGPSAPNTRPASVQRPTIFDHEDLQSVAAQASCTECEELKVRMKKVENALLGL